jgi:hypothetical protein
MCVAGMMTCAEDGTSFGPCVGEVTPAQDVCSTVEDEDCDGVAAACPGEAVWADGAGDVADQRVNAIAVDSAGNSVIVGAFAGKLAFGATNLTSGGGFDAFIAKLDALGKPLWAMSFGDQLDQSANGVALDSSGNIIVTGDFKGVLNFGGDPLGTMGAEDIFVAKLDSSGKHVWSKRFGDAGFQAGRGVTADSSGNITLLSSVEGSTTFGGGLLVSAGATDVALTKLNPGGNHLYSKIFGGAGVDTAGEIASDSKGNIVLTGSFSGNITFGGASLVSTGGNDVFAVRFSDAGIHFWSKRFGDAAEQTGRSVELDGAGNVLITGAFLGSIDFGGGALTSAGSEDIFAAKLDSDGMHVWSKGFGDASQQVGRAIAADSAGNVIVTGSLAGSADFGGGPLASAGLADVFLIKLSAAGEHVFSRAFGDADDQVGRAVATDATSSILLGGHFKGSLDLGNISLTSTGSYDLFITKIAP